MLAERKLAFGRIALPRCARSDRDLVDQNTVLVNQRIAPCGLRDPCVELAVRHALRVCDQKCDRPAVTHDDRLCRGVGVRFQISPLRREHFPDSLFDQVARGLRFKVNRTELMPNDPFVTYYNDTLVPLLNKMDLVFCGVIVKGAASPEGPYENNVRLSRERTIRLMEFLRGESDVMRFDNTNTNFITEDYGYLVTLMRKANDPEAEKVAEIWKQCNGDEKQCKQKLRAYNGGRTWNRLLKEYFPTLRQSRVVLLYAPNPLHTMLGIRTQPADTHLDSIRDLPRTGPWNPGEPNSIHAAIWWLSGPT